MKVRYKNNRRIIKGVEIKVCAGTSTIGIIRRNQVLHHLKEDTFCLGKNCITAYESWRHSMGKITQRSQLDNSWDKIEEDAIKYASLSSSFIKKAITSDASKILSGSKNKIPSTYFNFKFDQHFHNGEELIILTKVELSEYLTFCYKGKIRELKIKSLI